jgi:5-methylcytosine-specific restriction endonuclease McrA
MEYICEACDRSFARKENLNKHIKRQACKERNFACEYCGACFTNASNLTRHLKTVCKVKNSIEDEEDEEEDQDQENGDIEVINYEELKNELTEEYTTQINELRQEYIAQIDTLKRELNTLKITVANQIIKNGNKVVNKQNNVPIQDINEEIIINKRKSIPIKLKAHVWNKYVGKQYGTIKCFCCETTDICQIEFHCAHIISVANGGIDSIENLRPCCAQCNLSMGTQDFYGFQKYFTKNNKININ